LTRRRRGPEGSSRKKRTVNYASRSQQSTRLGPMAGGRSSRRMHAENEKAQADLKNMDAELKPGRSVPGG